MSVVPVMRPWLGDEEGAAAAEAIASGWVAQGPRVAAFEAAFANRIDAAHGVAVSSCTTALHLCLHLAGVGPGDEVVVPSLSFIATANAVRHAGAEPVFADVDLHTGNVTAATVDPVLGPRTRAVVLVHQGGVPADVEDLHRLCAARGIELIEDAACAAGSTYHRASVGAGARFAAWSFHPRKLLTTGEGGMLTTDDEEIAARARRLREHGMSISAAERHTRSGPVMEQYLEVGFNYRMTDIQAAVGLVQLGKLDLMVSRRRQLAARYQRLLGHLTGVRTVCDPDYGTSNYQSFWVELTSAFPVSRDELLQHLFEHGISARPGIMAAHRQPAYEGHPLRVPLPVTERLTDRTLILPLFHTMTECEQDAVIAAIRDTAGRRAA